MLAGVLKARATAASAMSEGQVNSHGELPPACGRCSIEEALKIRMKLFKVLEEVFLADVLTPRHLSSLPRHRCSQRQLELAVADMSGENVTCGAVLHFRSVSIWRFKVQGT